MCIRDSNYFVASDTKIMTDKDNTKDLYAALDAYYTLWISARDKEAGNPTGKLAKRVNKNLNNYYNTSFKSIIDRMKDRANEQGEGTRRSSNAGPMATALFEFQDYIDAMAYTYGLKKPPMAPTDVNQGNPNANPNQPTPRNPGPQMEGGQQQVPVMPVPVGGQ